MAIDFLNLPFEIDEFQKKCFSCIDANENVLVTAPTSSGKTLCALYAIDRNLKQFPGKKIIYTSPIKSLSNQKYYELKRKFPSNTVGIITGDMKYRSHADIIVMTTEILRNSLHLQREEDATKQVEEKSSFHDRIMSCSDIRNISLVIFDEIHYIESIDRGHMWEESIIMLPKQTNILMLSATLANPENFINWMINIKGKKCTRIHRENRVVPLRHFVFFFGADKKHAKITNKLIKIYDENKMFYSNKFNSILSYTRKNKNKIMGGNGLTQLAAMLKQKKMLPGLLFVLSKKKSEELAHKINYCFNKKEESVQVEKFVRQKLMSLKSRKYFMSSHRYESSLALWKKGIAYHHAGLQNIFKELVELLLCQGLIKFVIATETFSVGINAPINTVLFSSLLKIDGISSKFRLFNPQEYQQMCGRAGRRGIDTVGNCIILLNTFSPCPNKLTPAVMHSLLNSSNNPSGRKDMKVTYSLYLKTMTQKCNIDRLLNNSFTEIPHSSVLRDMYTVLQKLNFVDEKNEITEKGYMASKVNEMNELLAVEIIEQKILNPQELKTPEICAILSIFIPYSSHTGSINTESERCLESILQDELLSHSFRQTMFSISKINNDLDFLEQQYQVQGVNTHWFLNHVHIRTVLQWCKGTPLEKIDLSFPFIGEFVKNMLLLDNIVSTFQRLATHNGDVLLANKLHHGHQLIVRDMICSESLYLK